MRYMVRQKHWVGYWNWHGKKSLGEQTWDFTTRLLPNNREALKFWRSLGCECCARPPLNPKLSRWYRTGYADWVIIRKRK